jgi:uncharacterized RDD family membrane protein YckC
VTSSDQLRIDTPEQIALELPIAGVGSRFLALAVDTLLQALLYILVLSLLALAALVPSVRDLSSFGPAFVILLTFCVYWGYFAIFEIVWRGQTPGKRLARIRVIRDSGRPIDATAAILRNLLRVVDFLPAMYGAGVCVMLLNRNSRRLGDFVAGTVVVHEREATSIEPTWSATAPAVHVSPQSAQITDTELVLLETYLDRRWEYTEAVRHRAAVEIATRLAERTGLRPERGQSLDDFLESLARQARDAGRLRSSTR